MHTDKQTSTDLDTLAFATADLTNQVMMAHLAARGLFDRDSRPDLVDAVADLCNAVSAMQDASEVLLGMVSRELPGDEDDDDTPAVDCSMGSGVVCAMGPDDELHPVEQQAIAEFRDALKASHRRADQ